MTLTLQRLFMSLACMITTLFWTVDAGNAMPVVFADLIHATPPVYFDGNGKKGPTTSTIEHDITDNGFIPGLQAISQAVLHITFSDDLPPCCRDTGERIKVTIGGTTYGPWEIDHMDMFPLTLDSVALADLNADGHLGVLMAMHNRGDLNFISAELVEQLASMPEPSTFMLLGSGLAVLAGYGFRRRQRVYQD